MYACLALEPFSGREKTKTTTLAGPQGKRAFSEGKHGQDLTLPLFLVPSHGQVWLYQLHEKAPMYTRTSQHENFDERGHLSAFHCLFLNGLEAERSVVAAWEI